MSSAELSTFGRLLEELTEAHPEEDDRFRELEAAHFEVVFAAEKKAVKYHGKVILAAITGKLYATPAGVPDWELSSADPELSEILS